MQRLIDHLPLILVAVTLLGLVALLLHPSVDLIDRPTMTLPLLLIGGGLCKCWKHAPEPAAPAQH